MKFLLLLVTFALLLLDVSVETKKPNPPTTPTGNKYFKSIPGICDATTQKKADQMLQRLVTTGRRGRKFPESLKQLPAYCSESEHLITQLNRFIVQCYTPEIRDIAKIMVYSVKNLIKQFCRKRSRKLSKLLPVAKCINTEVTNGTCMRAFIERTAKFQYLREDKMKIPYTCCEYTSAITCVEHQLETIPCAAKNLPIVLDFIKGLFGNMANFACGDYTESTTRCTELGPPPASVLGRRPAKHYNTFMFVLIDLMESMEGFSLL